MSEAAEQLGVSPARVRQRIADGSLVAEKIGGRWLVDLGVSPPPSGRGRPAKSDAVWNVLADVPDPGVDLLLPDGSVAQLKASESSRRRGRMRLHAAARAAADMDHPQQLLEFENVLAWLRRRSARRQFRAVPIDLPSLREDERLLRSGVSDPRSGMRDARVVEAYVAASEVEDLIRDHWLEPLAPGEEPNVILHVAPGRPSHVSLLMLAADLAEHGGARERHRANELLAEALS